MSKKHPSQTQKIKKLEIRLDKELRRLERKIKASGDNSQDVEVQRKRVERFKQELEELGA